MYKKLRDELIHDNILLMERLKAMNYNFPEGTLEENMMIIDKNSQEILKNKFKSGEIENNNKSKSYYFITINKEGNKEQLKELYDQVCEALHRYKWLRKSVINYEYYTKEGQHPHSHMVVDTGKRKDTIIWLLSKFFKVNKNFIDIKRYYNDPINHINYVKGIKADSAKDEYINKDTLLRDELNIPHYTDNWE